MTILTFIFSILIVLSIMTYSRIEQFKNTFFTETLFVSYMEEAEVANFNKKNKDLYTDLPATEKAATEAAEQERIKASTKISLSSFLNREERQKNEATYTADFFVLKNTIQSLYSSKKFYKDFIERKGEDAVTFFLGQLADIAPSYSPLENIETISSIDLNDNDSNLFFFHMLKGNEKKEEDIKENYPSLLSFLTTHKQLPFRIYLLPKELLPSFFPDPLVVKAIISTRKSLYNDLKKDETLKADTLTARFKSEFERSVYHQIPNTLTDFSVSKTSPP